MYNGNLFYYQPLVLLDTDVCVTSPYPHPFIPDCEIPTILSQDPWWILRRHIEDPSHLLYLYLLVNEKTKTAFHINEIQQNNNLFSLFFASGHWTRQPVFKIILYFFKQKHKCFSLHVTYDMCSLYNIYLRSLQWNLLGQLIWGVKYRARSSPSIVLEYQLSIWWSSKVARNILMSSLLLVLVMTSCAGAVWRHFQWYGVFVIATQYLPLSIRIMWVVGDTGNYISIASVNYWLVSPTWYVNYYKGIYFLLGWIYEWSFVYGNASWK